ncbi:MAG: preprotein translocase subunit SecA [Gemmatimonadetes bacterium]|nr:preprotein translocase subunit SecA [Gemmatimonadota bacterium]
MLGKLISKVFGTKNDRIVKKLQPIVDEINEEFEGLSSLSDDELKAKTTEFRARLADDEDVDDLMVEAFAVVKEACRRHVGKSWRVSDVMTEWNMVHYDVQLIGGIVLHEGKIAEMATGEGKTLVATLPIYLNALTGKGVHLVTVNDYLAMRDREWMGPIFEFLGLTIGCIQHDMTPPERRAQYECDITYGTNNEFGFDYLRDNMAQRKENQVQRGFAYAIVDEVDSVLIDEARTPLIISGPAAHSSHQFDKIGKPVKSLVRKQSELANELVREARKALESESEDEEFQAGVKLLQVKRGAPKNKAFTKILQETGIKKLIARVEADFMREKRLRDVDEDLYYTVDEKTNAIDLTDRGRSFLSPNDPELFTIPNLPDEITAVDEDDSLDDAAKTKRKEEVQRVFMDRNEAVHNISQLLKAHSLFEKDVDYVVQEGKVLIVDEFTGRLMPGRRFSDGLHQALEAKEGVTIERETQTFATITLQNYFRMYAKIAGMTGTAETEEAEFYEIYKLEVAVIPTNIPIVRDDENDLIFKTRREKFNAIVEEIAECYKSGQPVLVGTASVDASETVSRILKRRKVPHQVLNAKQHGREAEVVRRAGEERSVTIATNMAGRGTDIKLGPGVKERGGLRIIGTERHESRRIDRQLRGRAGRQGDPGSSLFFLSLEDDLMRLFAPERIAGVMDKLGLKEGEVIEHPLVTRAIERAQKKVEAHNFEIRKHLLKYDDVMNQQREVIYTRRNTILEATDLQEEILLTMEDAMDEELDQLLIDSDFKEDWPLEEFQESMTQIFLDPFALPVFEEDRPDKEEVREQVMEHAKQAYLGRRTERLAFLESQNPPQPPEEILCEFERGALLFRVDEQWKDHLYELDGLKSGIGLRAYGQKDPLLEYKSEAFTMFKELITRIDRESIQFLMRPIQLHLQPQRQAAPLAQGREIHAEAATFSGGQAAQPAQGAPAPGGGAPRPAQPAPRQTLATVQRSQPKVGRNEPCPCGSGKKYKTCCGK